MNRLGTGALFVFAGLAVSALGAASAAEGTEVAFPQYPALSPDGSMMSFSWAGDLWIAPRSGGVATRLTSHPAQEDRSAFSPDGTKLAFESDRDGVQNIYVLDLVDVGGTRPVAGAVRRVTWGDRGTSLGSFSADGESVLFSSAREPSIYRSQRMYRAPLDGGPIERITDAFGSMPRSGPDGTVVFERGYNPWYRPIYRGPGAHDSWKFDPATGDFTQLTAHPANDGEGWPLGDGSTLLVSSRDGQNNVYRLRAGVTDANARAMTQLTDFEPGNEPTIGHGVRDLTVSADGSTAAFAVWDTLYTLDLTRQDASPEAVGVRATADADLGPTKTIDLSGEASEAVLSPDGEAIALVVRGEIVVRGVDEDRPTRRVTEGVSRDHSIAWTADGTGLFFVSDRDGADAIYRATVELSRADIEHQAEMAKKKAEEDEAEAEEPAEPEEPAEAADETGEEGSEPGDEPAEDAAEDAKKAEKKKDEPKGPEPSERWATGLRFAVEEVLSADEALSDPTPSPDGKKLAYTRGLGDLMLLDLETGATRELEAGWNEPGVFWASDSVHIVYDRSDLDFNSDIFLLDTRCESGDCEPVNITRHPDIDTSPRLSHDGKVLYFLSDRAGTNWDMDVYAVFLDRSLDDLADYELAAYFDDQKSAAKKLKPVEPKKDDAEDAETDDEDSADAKEAEEDAAEDEEVLTFETQDAYLRVRRLTSIPAGEGNLAVTPAGDRVIFSSTIDDDRGLFSVDYRGRERKDLASGGVGSVGVSLTGDKVVYVRSGRAATTGPEGGKTTSLPISARATVEVAAEQRQKFEEAARRFGAGFYHPTLKGVDWDAISATYADLAARTRTSSAFNRLGNMLFGEVDGSHTGMRGGQSFDAPSERVGYLGIDVRPDAGGYRVTRVLDDGPADQGDEGLLVGDLIVAIGSQRLESDETAAGVIAWDRAMTGTQGEETLFEVIRGEPGVMDATGAGPNAETVYLVLTPQGWWQESTLGYEAEVAERRAAVERLSDGRLGYLHIRGMSEPSVREFERDLYAAAGGREGLVIDVRDNGGGWTTDILLASLTAPRHAYTIPRGADESMVSPFDYPRDRRLIYAYQRPINVLINANSFSNAEIFAHSIKTIGRGTIVGEQTFGGVISTGGFSLIDGTTVRMPFRGWYLPDGTDMEHNGTIPDLPVPLTPADEAAGRDPQLEAAVDELLGRVRGSASAGG